jgi:SLT domain-containing protein
MYDTAAANYAAAFSAMGAFKEAHAVGTYGIGGIINREQLALLGEEGPEAVIPLEKMQFYMNKWIKPQGSGLTINGPLIVVQGNADERTAKLAADLVMNRVRRLVQT